MKSYTKEFIDRIFTKNRTRWWAGLSAETPKKTNDPDAKFLETALKNELAADIPLYRNSDRRLYFFSNQKSSSIDGRYKNLGVEEKFNPLDLREHLIDGAIHRGIVWSLGNPQAFNESPDALTLYVVKPGSAPMSASDTDIYLPVVRSIAKFGVYLIFVNGESGDYWHAHDENEQKSLPTWLSAKTHPNKWDLGIEKQTEANKRGLAILNQPEELVRLPSQQKTLAGLGKSGQFVEYTVDESCKVAVIDYGNQWRLIELGLLLRASGYDAVKASYNRTKHKNAADRTKELSPASKGVESRIAEKMMRNFSVMLDWYC